MTSEKTEGRREEQLGTRRITQTPQRGEEEAVQSPKVINEPYGAATLVSHTFLCPPTTDDSPVPWRGDPV